MNNYTVSAIVISLISTIVFIIVVVVYILRKKQQNGSLRNGNNIEFPLSMMSYFYEEDAF